MSQHPNNFNSKTIHEAGYDAEANNNGIQNDDRDIALTTPSILGIPLKHISLVTLALQNSLLTLIMHHSRVSTPPSRTYSAATAVLMNEILKCCISLVIAFVRVDRPSAPYSLPELAQAAGPSWPKSSLFRLQRLNREVFSLDCWKLSIPAILYVVQNNLQYVAASNLDAATFQVTYQMKILTTAGFSVLLLRRKLSSSQWLALLFLAIGVGIVQIQAGAAKGISVPPSEDVHIMNRLKGFLAVVAACFTSGLAGVYFEMVLKNSQSDLWIRNVQLSLFSIIPALAPVALSHAPASGLATGGWWATFFQNFGAWAWATVIVQVVGGLVTAMVIKYSDNILKGFATSLSIVISFLASTALFDFKLTFTFALGSVIVLIATWLYNQPPKRVASTDSMILLARSEKAKSPSFSPRPPISMYKESRSSSTTSLASFASTVTQPLNESEFLYGREKSIYIR